MNENTEVAELFTLQVRFTREENQWSDLSPARHTLPELQDDYAKYLNKQGQRLAQEQDIEFRFKRESLTLVTEILPAVAGGDEQLPGDTAGEEI